MTAPGLGEVINNVAAHCCCRRSMRLLEVVYSGAMPSVLVLMTMLMSMASSVSAFRPLARRISSTRMSMKNPTVFFDVGTKKSVHTLRRVFSHNYTYIQISMARMQGASPLNSSPMRCLRLLRISELCALERRGTYHT
jgi:hypothetical protein